MKLTVLEELRTFLPPLPAEDRDALEKAIVKEGCIDPIVVWDQGTETLPEHLRACACCHHFSATHDHYTCLLDGAPVGVDRGACQAFALNCDYESIDTDDEGASGRFVIVDGHHRYEICSAHDLPFDIKVKRFESVYHAMQWMHAHDEHRRQRSAYENIKLALQYEPYLRAAAKERMLAGVKADPVQKAAQGSVDDRKTRDAIARAAGVSHDTVAKVSYIDKHADEPVKEKLRNDEISINKAYEETRKAEAHKSEAAPEPKFNRVNDNISWAKWSWNPVTGCKYGCQYCYAKDIAARFYDGDAARFEPTFHENRLLAPSITKPQNSTDPRERSVFVCSMGELFGPWVPDEWIDKVFNACLDNPQWRYLFLTKNPARYADHFWSRNHAIGTTIDKAAVLDERLDALSAAEGEPYRWLSLEPLLDPLEKLDASMLETARIDLVVIGAQSKSTTAPEYQPPWSWAYRIAVEANKAGCSVYQKPNFSAVPREMPWTEEDSQ